MGKARVCVKTLFGWLMAIVSLLGATERPQAADTRSKNPLPEAFALGSTSMPDVLYELGPADSAYLAGADGEGRGEPGDNVVLAY